jgi:diguanylate cyclase (GGDEF)-like protein
MGKFSVIARVTERRPEKSRMRPLELIRETDSSQATKLYLAEYHQMSGKTDRLIACIMGLQYAGAIIASLVIGGQAEGGIAARHPDLLPACLFGGLLTFYPIYLAIVTPGKRATRHLIAAFQMLMSGLLIYISGGRIETHFHIFGSIALLSLYLDWEVLVTATVTTLLDHTLMGYFMPACLFGASKVDYSRIVEHVLWVLVFDVFLIIACVQSQKRLKTVAKREADQVYQAYHDALTGLGNRLLLQKHMEEAACRQSSYIFMGLDLDKFKEVNDTMGHNTGDQLLSQASKRMAAEIRETDYLIRMGGDEFALIISACDDVNLAKDIAGRILKTLHRPFLYDGQSIQIGASIGIYPNLNAATATKDVLHNADLALYKAKHSGRNNYLIFDWHMEAQTLRDMSLEHRLREAVASKSLHLHYQPIVSTKGILLGFEALLRWDDAIHGSVSPTDFIPIAERCGIIMSLGGWVLQRACMQAAEWYRAGNKPVKMSVNVSSIQLTSDDFVSTVLRALKDSGLPAHLLDLELTESTLIQNHGETLKVLELLDKFGVRLSIDDFGTGYSSLSYLKDLPVHTLKIDRAFIKDIVQSMESRLLIEGMINMAHTLKLRVVAEGVETRDQLDVLVLAGCDEIQGFHISHAVSSEEADELIHHAEIDQRPVLRQSRRYQTSLDVIRAS